MVVAVLTFLCEAIGIGLAFNISPLMVLGAAFDFDPAAIRPGWAVLGTGLIVTAIDAVRARLAARRPMRGATAA
jgi:hypothetical protein